MSGGARPTAGKVPAGAGFPEMREVLWRSSRTSLEAPGGSEALPGSSGKVAEGFGGVLVRFWEVERGAGFRPPNE